MYIAKPMEMYDDEPNEQDNSQGFKYWNKMEANADVPTETILKYKVRECGQLKAEIDYLKNEIEWRDRAIADFKKWQSRMAEYKMEYWLCEAKKLLQESPNERKFKAAAKLLKKNTLFEKRYKSLSSQLRKLVAARKELQQIISEDANPNEVAETPKDK